VLSPPAAGDADFGGQVTAAVSLWKANLGDLAILTLVLLLVVWVPMANIGFVAGYIRALLKVARGEGRAQVGDLFSAWDCFGNLFVYCLINLVGFIVLGWVPFFGPIASIALGFLVIPGIFAIVDRKKGVVEAYQWSIATIQADFVNWLLAYVVGNVIGFAGLLLFLVGAIFTMPLGQLISVRQYLRARSA
jgi:hypothetical protein